MRKISLLAILSLSILDAVTNEQIINYFKSQVMFGNITVEVKERRQVPNYRDFEFVVVEIGENKEGADALRKQKLNILIKEGFIFPEAVDVKNGISLKQKVEDLLLYGTLAIVYKNELKSNIISLGDAKKPALVIFSDPECPYCGQELANAENRLKTNSLKIILTPIHDFTALQKSALIYKECAKAKTDKKKLEILRKYYDENVFIADKVSKEETDKMDKLRQKYFKAGLESVPMIIEEKNILGK